jgi:LuxR family maltose regulon positive regulatory protein
MATSLLATKLYTPPIRSELVSRPRLIGRLSEGFHRKLTLVSAPAGFGKTTLLSDCAASFNSRMPVAWLSLDKGDNDPVRFWTHFFAAMQKIPSLGEAGVGEAALAMLLSSGISTATASPPVEAVLTGFLNELAEIRVRFILALDDFHLITEPQIHDGLFFLLDNLPPSPQGMHLIVSSRADPPWPLARLRARREMTELRVSDLRFTVEEATAFLNDVMGFGLSTEVIAALDTRTEGWIAGLQMAAISIRGRRRARNGHDLPHRDADLTGFIEAFTGSHRFVLDYLVEEVLDQQSPTIQAFLLKTSILERMTGPLCDAVVEEDGSQAILSDLDRANLFLVLLDDERRWYRYHHLFADLLRSRLQQTLPGQVHDLHRRASEWYEQNGLIAEAVTHALSADDIERVARLVEGHALDTIYHGQLATLMEWLDTLPSGVVRSRPWLCVAHAWIHASTGQWDDVEPLLRDAERTLRIDAAEREADTQHLAGHIEAIRAYAAAIQFDLHRARELARRTLDLVPKQDLTVRNLASTLLGAALRLGGSLAEASRVWNDAVTTSRAAGDSRSAAMLLSSLASLQAEQGQLNRSAATCRQVLQLADESVRQGGRRLPTVAPVYARLSSLQREWNDPQEAVCYARDCLRLSEPWGHAEAVTTGYSTLAHALQTLGDERGALEAMQRAQRIASDLSPSYHARIRAEQAQLWLAQGNLAEASRWSQEVGLDVDDEPGFERMPEYLAFARLLLLQELPDQALTLVARLLPRLEAAGAMGSAIEALVLQARAFQAQADEAQALTALERALSLAEPEGYVHTFVKEGQPMARLLRQAVARGIAADYAGKLLAELEEETEYRPHTPKPPLPSTIEPLSDRELEVLRLLGSNLAIREIADELYIAVSTVRSHVKSIYGKLDVHSRMEAVARAQELGLL